MAYQSFLDAAGSTSYRKVTGAGTTGDPAVCHQIIDSGTLSATQSGTWNITNISGTISLPTGAATAAKQPALGTAGTPSSDVITVQGITSMTALKVDGSAVTQPVSLTSTTITGTVAATQSGTWTVTGSGGTFPVTDSGGSLTVDAPVGTPVYVRLSDGAAAISTLPVSLASVPSHAVTNAGTFAVQVDGAALTSLQLIDDGIATAGSAITTKGMVAAGTDGTNARILKTDSSGELQVDVLTLPALAAGTNLIGKAAAGLDVSNMYDGSTALTPKFAKLSSASTGNQALVSAVVGKKIRLLSLQILATASTNSVYVNDGTADLYGDSTRKIPLDVTGATGPGGITLPFNPIGWCETASTNRPLNINLGSANGIIAVATYVEV